MKVLLLGATGRLGKQLLETLLQEGHSVHVLVRNGSKVSPENGLKVFAGDPRDEKILRQAIEGCTSILSALNISRTSDFPWAKLRTPENFLSQTASAILTVTKGMTMDKVIICSAWGAGSSKIEVPKWFRWFIDHSNLSYAYVDHEKQEYLFLHSTLNFTIVRPVILTNASKKRQVKVSVNNIPSPSLTISRKNLAQFMVHLLKESKYKNEVITVSEI